MCESLCCWLHFVVLMQLINAKGGNCKTTPWQKHKSKKQPDMTETSPWLWWVTTRAKQQWAAVALDEIEQVNAWGMTWGGIILIRHTDSSRGLDLSPFFPAITHFACTATVSFQWVIDFFLFSNFNANEFSSYLSAMLLAQVAQWMCQMKCVTQAPGPWDNCAAFTQSFVCVYVCVCVCITEN